MLATFKLHEPKVYHMQATWPHVPQVGCLVAQEITRVGFVNNSIFLKSSTEIVINRIVIVINTNISTLALPLRFLRLANSDDICQKGLI